MATDLLNSVKNTVKYWYLPLIAGILFVIVGVWIFATPIESYLVLAILFSISFLISGISDIIFSVSNRKELDNWGWVLALGIISTILGGVLIIHPEISITTLPLFVGFVVLFRAISAISISIDLKRLRFPDWGYMLALGIIGTILGILLLFNPFAAGITLIIFTGFAFILLGIYSIYFSAKLKKIKNTSRKISKDLRERYEQIQKEIFDELHNKRD
ncbi:DUF308 domain-containing protein [Bacteroidales bacterium OttesenSCG-928-C19]|nr:DUF308 domain-containing protein [Bacteroidales bacterium OttesenSCG-928-C19]